MRNAPRSVQSSGREEVTGANVLVAMFAERESHAVYFLQEQDMTRFDAVSYISHGIAKAPGRSRRAASRAPKRRSAQRARSAAMTRSTPCVNLNKKAKGGRSTR